MSADVEPLPDFKERATAAKRCCMPKRYVQALLASLALFISLWMRTSFICAVISIMKSDYDICACRKGSLWTFCDIYFMDSSFSWGFAVAQIPGALLAIKFSCHSVVLVSMTAAICFHTVISFIMYDSPAFVIIILRLLQGIAVGPIFPACIGMWKSWAPPSERTRLISIVSSGSFFASVAGFPLNMALADNFGPWTCFFTSSVIGLIWCLLWYTLAHESPSSHPHISHYELKYLEENVDVDSKLKVTVKSIPWKSIILSLPVWVICLANLCYSCSEFILTKLPEFYSVELGFENSNQILDTLLPNIILGVIVATSGFFVDFLINRVRLSRNIVRKLHCSGAFALYGIAFMILTCYRNAESNLTCLNISQGFIGLALTGFMVNCLDLSAHYASIVMALCMTVGGLSTIILPVCISNFRIHDKYRAYYSIYGPHVTMSFITAVIYFFFGSGNLELWAKPQATRVQSLQCESSRSTYPDGTDGIELVMDRDESSNNFTELEKERY